MDFNTAKAVEFIDLIRDKVRDKVADMDNEESFTYLNLSIDEVVQNAIDKRIETLSIERLLDLL